MRLDLGDDGRVRELRREAHTAANGLAFSFVTYQNTARGD
jgi:hypothetical protein